MDMEKIGIKIFEEESSKYFITKLNKDVYNNSRMASKYFQNVFEKLQSDLKEDHPRASHYCGSTALCGIQLKIRKIEICYG